MNNKIKWNRTSVGGYIAVGGALMRSWSAYITQSESDDSRWYAAIEIDKHHEYSEHISVSAAKRWCSKKVKR